MASSSEEWVFEHIQQLGYTGLNAVAKTIGITLEDINKADPKISLVKVALTFLSSVDIETSEGSNIFIHIETFVHNNYKMAPTSLPNYQENFNNLVTKANELNKKTFENRF